MTLPTPLELGAIGGAMITGAVLLFIFVKVFEAAIIIGALGGALILFAGIASGYKQMGVDAQLAIDKPVLAACVTDKTTAVNANVSLQADVKRMAKEEQELMDASKDLIQSSKDAIARSAKAKAGNASKLAMLESDQAMIFRNAAVSLKGLSCPQVVKKVADDLHQLAVREYSDRPPADGIGPSKPPKAGLSVE